MNLRCVIIDGHPCLGRIARTGPPCALKGYSPYYSDGSAKRRSTTSPGDPAPRPRRTRPLAVGVHRLRQLWHDAGGAGRRIQVSLSTLAVETGLSKSSVQSALRRLQRRGYVGLKRASRRRCPSTRSRRRGEGDAVEHRVPLALRQAQGEGLANPLMLSLSKHEGAARSRRKRNALIQRVLELLAGTEAGLLGRLDGDLFAGLRVAALAAGAVARRRRRRSRSGALHRRP